MVLGVTKKVDVFKMKWVGYGVIPIVALAWAGGTYGPELIDMFASD